MMRMMGSYDDDDDDDDNDALVADHCAFVQTARSCVFPMTKSFAILALFKELAFRRVQLRQKSLQAIFHSFRMH
eukprot:4798927-Amphidinium_carterae.1